MGDAADHRVRNIEAACQPEAQPLQRRHAAQALLVGVGHRDRGHQPTFEAVPYELKEQVGLLAVQKVLLVQATDRLERRRAACRGIRH